jgi:HTH-type transcriptional regulator / antitoxin HigA
MTNSLNTFALDWISPPGETIAELMEEKGWTQNDLSQKLGYASAQVSLLLSGEESITEEVALSLEKVLGGKTSFWLSREAQYRSKLSQQSMAPLVADSLFTKSI